MARQHRRRPTPAASIEEKSGVRHPPASRRAVWHGRASAERLPGSALRTARSRPLSAETSHDLVVELQLADGRVVQSLATGVVADIVSGHHSRNGLLRVDSRDCVAARAVAGVDSTRPVGRASKEAS
jgi:hypothetical protein